MYRYFVLLVGLRLVLPLLFCIALAVYLLGGLLDAQWSVYADHELRSYRVGHHDIGVADLPRILMMTEVGHPGEFTRYRPTNYLMYAAESVFWGDNVRWLHAVRVINLAIFLCFVAAALRRWFSPIVTIGLCALLMTHAYWKHVLIGFGANEQYILLVAPLFLWSYWRVYPRPALQRSDASSAGLAWWLLCCVTAVLLAGIKENMTIVMLPLLWLAGVQAWRERRLDLRVAVAILACLAIAFIVGAVVVGVRHVGTDFYGNSVTLGHRLYTLMMQSWKYPMPLLLAALLGFGLAGCLRLPAGAMSPGWPVFAAHARHLFLLQAGLVILSLAHIFFYDGWPLDSRYAFPGEFFVFLSGVMVLHLALESVRAWHPSERVRAELFCGLALIVATAAIGYSDLRNQVKSFTVASREFTQTLDRIVAQANADPTVAIVVESATPYDLEPVFSINRYLLSFGVRNPIYLRPHDLRAASFPDNTFFHGMISTLENLSTNGEVSSADSTGTLPSPFLARFSKFDQLKLGQPCLSIQLAKAPTFGCTAIGVVKY